MDRRDLSEIQDLGELRRIDPVVLLLRTEDQPEMTGMSDQHGGKEWRDLAEIVRAPWCHIEMA